MNNEIYLFGNICGDSDVIVDQLIENFLLQQRRNAVYKAHGVK